MRKLLDRKRITNPNFEIVADLNIDGLEISLLYRNVFFFFFFKQKTAYEMLNVTGVQTCALPISRCSGSPFPIEPLDRSRAARRVVDLDHHAVELDHACRHLEAAGQMIEVARHDD